MHKINYKIINMVNLVKVYAETWNRKHSSCSVIGDQSQYSISQRNVTNLCHS